MDEAEEFFMEYVPGSKCTARGVLYMNGME